MGMTPASMIWGFDSLPELACGLTACILMSFVSFAFYMVQSRETGALGLITVLLIMLGNMLTACIIWGYLQYGNYGDKSSFLSLLTEIIASVGVLGGSVVLPVLSWRAKVFPRWVITLMAMMVASLALPWTGLFAFFWGLPYVGMGYCIWTGKVSRQSVPNYSVAA
jgi:hypothetical protein